MKGLKVRRQNGTIVVSFKVSRLTDDEQILRISEELKKILESASRGTRLLLDFRDVETVASMMLGDLVGLNKTASHEGVVLQLCRLSSNVLRVVQSCQLDRLFDIIPDGPSSELP